LSSAESELAKSANTLFASRSSKFSSSNANTTKTLEASSFFNALIELLNEKGLLTIEELDKRKKQVAQRLVNGFSLFQTGG
jgi:DNA-binding MurR/RpiR family transcriptional regulator